MYTDLTKLIIKIADYIFREEDNVRKGIGDIMGGNLKDLKQRERQLDVQKERQLDRREAK